MERWGVESRIDHIMLQSIRKRDLAFIVTDVDRDDGQISASMPSFIRTYRANSRTHTPFQFISASRLRFDSRSDRGWRRSQLHERPGSLNHVFIGPAGVRRRMLPRRRASFPAVLIGTVPSH